MAADMTAPPLVDMAAPFKRDIYADVIGVLSPYL